MKSPLRVLLVEDAPDDALLLERHLRHGGLEPACTRVDSASALDAALREGEWDVIISDYRLPGFNGLAALQQVQARGRDVPFLLVSGVIGEEQAVEAMKAGAHDFILKDKLARLVPAVERELRDAEVRRQRRLAAKELLQAQEALRQAHGALEHQVQERTAELVSTLAALQNEMAERRSLEARILEISEREQRRIGQDLHDSLCQQLTGINYLCTVAEQRLAQVAPAETAALARIGELLRDTIGQARSLARGLHPVENEANGLVAALTGLAESFRIVFQISARLVCSAPVLVEDNTVATHLYRIAQEAMSNAARHGQATQIVLRLSETPQTLTLSVRDNGCGFPAGPTPSQGLGLLTMKFRAKTIGADLSIQRGDHKGTVLTLTLSKKTNPHPTVSHE